MARVMSAPFYFLVFLFVVCSVSIPTAKAQEDDGALMAAVAAAAGPSCHACPVDVTPVCAEMPTARGVRQTVMIRCLAECQGFKNIQQGACEGATSSGPSIANSK